MLFFKPNIVISKCLNFDNCRFNWDKINDDFLLKLWKHVNFITVCPEVWIWLWTPRLPLRIFNSKDGNRFFQPWNKLDLTDKINSFSKKFLESQKNIDWFIMKNRSPSCWVWDVKIYDKSDSYSLDSGKWKWFFARNIDSFFSLIPIEDEWRLKNFRLREEFLTKIFCLSEFRDIKQNKKISLLAEFQAKNKYLFMAYSQDIQVKLWRIVASYDKTNLDEIFEKYFSELLKLFNTDLSIWKLINSFIHIFGYFKNHCSSEEKLFFSEMLEVYREGRIPTSSIILMLKSYSLRERNDYIIKQTILSPYPRELVELSDSWRDLKL